MVDRASNPALNSEARLSLLPREWAIWSKLPRSYGACLKSGVSRAYAVSQSARTSARNEVFPVLFSPTRSVRGANRTDSSSRKQRKLSNRISYTAMSRSGTSTFAAQLHAALRGAGPPLLSLADGIQTDLVPSVRCLGSVSSRARRGVRRLRGEGSVAHRAEYRLPRKCCSGSGRCALAPRNPLRPNPL